MIDLYSLGTLLLTELWEFTRNVENQVAEQKMHQ